MAPDAPQLAAQRSLTYPLEVEVHLAETQKGAVADRLSEIFSICGYSCSSALALAAVDALLQVPAIQPSLGGPQLIPDGAYLEFERSFSAESDDTLLETHAVKLWPIEADDERPQLSLRSTPEGHLQVLLSWESSQRPVPGYRWRVVDGFASTLGEPRLRGNFWELTQPDDRGPCVCVREGTIRYLVTPTNPDTLSGTQPPATPEALTSLTMEFGADINGEGDEICEADEFRQRALLADYPLGSALKLRGVPPEELQRSLQVLGATATQEFVEAIVVWLSSGRIDNPSEALCELLFFTPGESSASRHEQYWREGQSLESFSQLELVIVDEGNSIQLKLWVEEDQLMGELIYEPQAHGESAWLEVLDLLGPYF